MFTMFKKLSIIIFSIIIFCSSTLNFASIVSSDDGPAFITKNEFETLKKSFDEQIEIYNNSLDRKIDGAIASYLKGLSIVEYQHCENFLEIAEKAWNKNLYWSGATTVESSRITNISRFCVSVIQAYGTLDTVGAYTDGFCDTLDHYNNGYPVLKKNASNEIVYNTKYKPLLTYNIAYFRFDVSGNFGANLSSWSSYTHFGQNQNYIATQYWLGYFNNRAKVEFGDTDSYASRTVSVVFNPSEAYNDFVMAPLATSNCSIWDPHNTTASSTADGSYPDESIRVYRSGITGGTNSSTNVLSSYNSALRSPDFSCTLPWVSTGNVYNEQTINLNGQSVKPCKMKYGLPVTQAIADGTIKFKINANVVRIGWYKNNPMLYDSIPTAQKQTITTNGTVVNGEIAVDKGDILFFIYLPDELDRLRFYALDIVEE